jgi:nucleoside-diphosphate-sugar epimerase
VSFTPEEMAAAIRKRIPGFEIAYAPDFRQQIADSWPRSIDDSVAQTDWGWGAQFNLDAIVADMLDNLGRTLK